MTSFRSSAIGASVLLVAGTAGSAIRAGDRVPAVRRFEATYVGTIAAPPAGAKRVEIWVPLPGDNELQKVTDVKVEGPAVAETGTDSAGNAVAHILLAGDSIPKGESTVNVRFRVERKEAVGLSAGESKTPEPLAPFLGENRLVPLTPRIRELAKSLAAGATDPVEKARAFYSYLVDTGTYDKIEPGWGKGDSERFCNVKKGNCTDFHSAFMALARAEGIPVRFRIGFPLKADKAATVPGYHCWAEFHVAGKGWIPVDASDAAKSKDPAKKAYLFGNLDADRFDISKGRDLTLSPAQKDGPVNFLIYPYVEVDGKAFTDAKIRLEYTDV